MFLLLANFSQIPTCVIPWQPLSLKKSWNFEIICWIVQKLFKKFAWAPMKKRHLSPLCVCACSLFDKVRVFHILLSLRRKRWFFLSSPPLFSLHLLTSFGDGRAINITNVHGWFANSVYYLLHAITSKLLLCTQV